MLLFSYHISSYTVLYRVRRTARSMLPFTHWQLALVYMLSELRQCGVSEIAQALQQQQVELNPSS